MKTSDSKGIFWINGILRIGEQLKLALGRGYAHLKIPFSWRYTRIAAPGLPAGYPTVQISIDFRGKANKPSLLKRFWHWIKSLLRN